MERIRSLYLHVPFCTWVCKYCDFNTYAVLEGLIPAYTEALVAEIRAAAQRYPVGPLDTIFFGGGTPSLLTTDQLQRLLGAISDAIGIAPDAEVSLEANPGNVTDGAAAGWLAAGITRLSIGVQALHPGALRFLERLHSGEEALDAVTVARRAGFGNVNCDLLYGIPGVSLPEWLSTLDRMLALRPTHLSAYELTVEPSTRLHQEVSRGEVTMPDAEEQLGQYWAAAERLERGGFTHYEISNWATPGFECRHNLTYWQYRPYLGCGAGAHSLLRLEDGASLRFWNRKGPHAYIRAAHESGDAVDGREVLSPDRARGEAAMIGIRLLRGTDAAQGFEPERRQLVGAGLLVQERDRVRLTTRGVELANQVGATFLQDLG
ncbi:MAG TPA: radical SAM family heme chaperone HemW [Candidatus Limnocylindrales bacterium]|nr:radical SAM family heme chaperone HemW [Candidatus Limnocylindrales bacterium]